MPRKEVRRNRSLGEGRMKITVVGAALTVALVVVVVLCVRALNQKQTLVQTPIETGTEPPIQV
jgi:hypothetical protein